MSKARIYIANFTKRSYRSLIEEYQIWLDANQNNNDSFEVISASHGVAFGPIHHMTVTYKSLPGEDMADQGGK